MREFDLVEKAEMRAAGLEPVGSNPGPGVPWPARCTTCDKVESGLTLLMVRKGAACRNCFPRGRWANRIIAAQALLVFQAAGLDPEPGTPFPGPNKAWKSTCRKNPVHRPAPALSALRRGSGCKNCNSGQHLRVPYEQVVAEFRQARLTITGDYVEANKPVACRCLDCGRTPNRSLSELRSPDRAPCARCRRQADQEAKAYVAEAVMAAAGFNPETPYPGGAGIGWTCRCIECGRRSRRTLSGVRGGERCPHADPGRPRVEEQQAIVELLAAGAVPSGPFPGTMKRWESTCLHCGEPTAPTLHNLRAKKDGQRSACRPCGIKRYARTRLHDEAEARAIMLAANLRPDTDYPGMNDPWPSTCLVCDNQVKPTFGNVKHAGTGCNPCSWAAQSERQRIPDDEAWADMLAAGLFPSGPYAGDSKQAWTSLCLDKECAAEVSPSLHSIRQGSGCPECAPRRAGERRRITPEAALAELKELRRSTTETFPGLAHLHWNTTCDECGQTSRSSLVTLRILAKGRPEGGACCPVRRFQNLPALIYVLFHPDLSATKIGITSKHARRHRLVGFMAAGWQVRKTFDFDSGLAAYDVEQAVLKHFGEHRGFLEREQVPNGGYTETFDSETVAALDLTTQVAIRRAALKTDPPPVPSGAQEALFSL